MFPASFLTIAQSVNRCSLSETFFASSKATASDAVFVACFASPGEVVTDLGLEDADLVEPCVGLLVCSELARCRYVRRGGGCRHSNRAAYRPCVIDVPTEFLHAAVVWDTGRKERPKPVATRRELAWRIAYTMGGFTSRVPVTRLNCPECRK